MKTQPIKLKNITTRITKGTTPTTMGFDFIDYGINYIKAEALNGDSELDMQSFSYINDVAHNKLKRSILQNNDVLVTIAGVNIGKVGIVKQKHLPANTNQAVGIVRIKPELANSSYIYYWFKNPSTFNHLQNINAQAAQPNINLEMLGDLSLLLPDIQNQQRIASAIAAYDELINTNRRQIQLLEESARLLFREWFVYFRFPGHEKMKIVDGVPEGWERKPIAVLTSFLSRGVAPHYDEDADGLVINQKCIRGGRLDVSLALRQSREFKPDRQVQLGDVLINSTGEGTLGRVAQVLAPIASCTVDTHITIARPIPKIGVHYFGQSLMAWEPRLSTMGRGATNQTELSRGQIGEIDILVPSHSLVQQFEEYSEPIFSQVSTLLEQNQKLKVARDLLLPRLMSGAIEV